MEEEQKDREEGHIKRIKKVKTDPSGAPFPAV